MMIFNVSFGDRCGNGCDCNYPTGGGEPAVAMSHTKRSEQKLKQMYDCDVVIKRDLQFEKDEDELSKFQKLMNAIKTKFSK
jgi:hypothetical protein